MATQKTRTGGRNRSTQVTDGIADSQPSAAGVGAATATLEPPAGGDAAGEAASPAPAYLRPAHEWEMDPLDLEVPEHHGGVSPMEGSASHAVGYGAMSAGGALPAGVSAGSYAGGAGSGGWGSGRRGGYGRAGTQAPDARGVPSQYQVREITQRGLPVPPTYGEAQALLDSFEPTVPQQRRLEEIGLSAGTRGEAKKVIADFLAANPHVQAQWEAQNAQGRVQRRQERRGGQEPTVTTEGMFRLLAAAGVTQVPSDYATAAAMIDALPPSDNMVQVLKQHGRAVPATRAEAVEVIRGLDATPDQIVTIMRRTGGRWAPQTRGDAERWFRNNPPPRNAGAEAQYAA